MSSPIFQNPKSGSIKLSGTYEIVDEQGNVLESVTDPKLCGCGLSQTKPLCDKSHANYVANVVRMLEDARSTVMAVNPVGVWPLRAFEIRKRALENRIATGEKLIGVKFGGALLKGEGEKRYEGIYGYLTDAMLVRSELKLQDFIHPIAEAEIVFKLSRPLDREISASEGLDFVAELAPGIEVFDCRYGNIDPYIDDAIADNACAGAIAIGNWIDAKSLDPINATIEIFEGNQLKESVPATNIAGNPWNALANVSKRLIADGVTLPEGSIVFSGSATTGIVMKASEYRVEISGLGSASFNAIN